MSEKQSISRIARIPAVVPSGVEVKVSNNNLSFKGPKGQLDYVIPSNVKLAQNDNELTFAPTDDSKAANALAGTTSANVKNILTGVHQGFEKKLILKGVGYRAQVKGKELHLTLGLSHPVEFKIPEGIAIECPTQTDITIQGIDKQKVGQVAADIRRYRPPEPYKGKGIRYADEHVVIKETKKK